jgi:hypothetical protein
MKSKYELWLDKYFVASYYDSVYTSKRNAGEYRDFELEHIYESIMKEDI